MATSNKVYVLSIDFEAMSITKFMFTDFMI